MEEEMEKVSVSRFWPFLGYLLFSFPHSSFIKFLTFTFWPLLLKKKERGKLHQESRKLCVAQHVASNKWRTTCCFTDLCEFKAELSRINLSRATCRGEVTMWSAAAAASISVFAALTAATASSEDKYMPPVRGLKFKISCCKYLLS